MVGLPLEVYVAPLLSSWNWEPNLSFPVPHAPKRIDPELFPDFRQVDFVGYATNPLKSQPHHTYHRMSNVPRKKIDVLLLQQQAAVGDHDALP